MVRLESICKESRHVKRAAVSYSHDIYPTREQADADAKAKAADYQEKGYPNSFLLERSAEEPPNEQRALMPIYYNLRMSDIDIIHTLLAYGLDEVSFVGPPAIEQRGKRIVQALKSMSEIDENMIAHFAYEGDYNEISLERSMREALKPFGLQRKESVLWKNGDIPLFHDFFPVLWDKDLNRHYSILDWNVLENLSDPEILDRRFHHKLAKDNGFASALFGALSQAFVRDEKIPEFDHYKEPNLLVIGQFHTKRPYRLAGGIYPNRKLGSMDESNMGNIVMKMFSGYDLGKSIAAAVALSPYATARFAAKTIAKKRRSESNNSDDSKSFNFTWRDMNYLFNAALGGSVLCKGSHDDWTRVLDGDQWGDVLKFKAIMQYAQRNPEHFSDLYPYMHILDALNEELAPLNENGPLSPDNFPEYANRHAVELSDTERGVLMAQPFDRNGLVTKTYMSDDRLQRYLHCLETYRQDFEHNKSFVLERVNQDS